MAKALTNKMKQLGLDPPIPVVRGPGLSQKLRVIRRPPGGTGTQTPGSRQSPMKPVSMSYIAELAGVSQPVVSAVLNNNYSRIRVSGEKRKLVQNLLDECKYYPDAKARALRSRRTGCIGFFLSDSIKDGWANPYYATMMQGIETECHERGYGLRIGRYNLSNLDSFVFPTIVGERSVDGILLTGYLQAEIVKYFSQSSLPCVCICDDLEVAEMVPVVANDFAQSLLTAVEYLAELGHRDIVYANETSRRAREIAGLLIEQAAQHPKTRHCRIEVLDVAGGHADSDAAEPLLVDLLDVRKLVHSTAILTSNQLSLALLSALHRRGLRCPEDISIISTSDTPMSTLSVPPLTSMDICQQQLGTVAAKILIDCLTDNVMPDVTMSRRDVHRQLICRGSCAVNRQHT